MKLSQLLRPIEILRLEGNSEVEISGIAYDSRRVNPGDVFICIKGFEKDGHCFAKEAVDRGAVAVVVENWQDLRKAVQVQVADSRQALALLSVVFFGNPASKIKLIGVTGTNGKTTTTYLLESILVEAGYKTGLIGTVEDRIRDRTLSVTRTTPESTDLQKLLAQMLKEGVQVVAMEVSSHALDLSRVEGCQFEVRVFTNLSQDHLDYHRTLEEYFKAKRALFARSYGERSTNVVNIDDQYGCRIARKSNSNLLTFGLSPEVDIRATEINLTSSGSNFLALTPQGKTQVSLKLRGAFNVYNALAALGVSSALGIPLPVAKRGLKKVDNIPGRFEVIQGKPFMVIVDYAHTPDSLEKLLTAVREICLGKIITVFGCGGDRDRLKRPLMGKVAGNLSDLVFITLDNPRSEKPEEIISQIEVGIKKQVSSSKYQCLVDRREAILAAISQAKKGDVVVIAGKGHEASQTFANRVVPFDDRVVAREALQELTNVSSKSR